MCSGTDVLHRPFLFRFLLGRLAQVFGVSVVLLACLFHFSCGNFGVSICIYVYAFRNVCGSQRLHYFVMKSDPVVSILVLVSGVETS